MYRLALASLFAVIVVFAVLAIAAHMRWAAEVGPYRPDPRFAEKVKEERELRVARLIELHPPPPFVPKEETLRFVLQCLRPAILLNNMTAQRLRTPDSAARFVDEIYVDRTDANPSDAERARLEWFAIERELWLRNDPEFRRAEKRLQQAGISCEFGGQGDYCGEFAVIRLRAPRRSLTRLERLAADDSGFTGWAERRRAAKTFRAYMIQKYGDGSLSGPSSAAVERSPYEGGSEQ